MTLTSPQSDRSKVESAQWLLGSVAIAFSFIASPLSSAVNIVSLALIILAVMVACLKSPEKLFQGAALTCVFALLWWAILLVNPNVVSLEGGLLGYRLTMTFVLGILLGIQWPTARRSPLAVVWYSIMFSCVASVILFLFFPAIEQSISRAAGEYTSLFQNERRLQGIFAGPFHAALAGVFLILTSLRVTELVSSRFWRWFGFGIGVLTLILSQVRVGFVALVVSVLIVILTSNQVGVRLKRLYGIGLAVLLIVTLFPGVLGMLSGIPALASLQNASTDTRFLGRTVTWQIAWQMIQQSPWIGWGPGSAGATLNSYFPSDGHITSHNMLLKFGVEGGLLGMVLIILLMGAVCFAVFRLRDSTKMGVAALVPVLVFGLTGSTVDTLPVSFALAVVFGYQISLSRGATARKLGNAASPTITSGSSGRGRLA